ncbi:hypothetical protein [Phytoactinopolyspora mesophila]|uniref:DUF8094 domain-containing protein n=1 Tax=Phytoactinopolyspora mesophila TaxID=2650750 RepID=A0A7K3M6Q5_9ACTN|nr:hypothetical protein [Phytoactinopolyspora mesophila]NDL58956.1 hypothetical protein [Phytoactinopolyspora mesophila]
MRTFFGVLLLVLGAPLLVAGGVAAAYVGPDNTVEVIEEQITTDAAVVATTPSALNATGPTLHVTADAGEAPTFIGIAHPVHVDSYLDDVTVEQITGIGWRGGLTHSVLGGGETTPRADPAGLDWWRDHATGSGAQQISFEMTDEPVRLVLASADLRTPVTVQLFVDAEIEGLFVTALLVGAGGVIFIVGGILLLRAGRRRRAEERALDADIETDTDTDLAATLGESDPSPPEPPPAPPTPPQRPGTLPRLAVIGGAGALFLTGCAQLPGTAETGPHSTVPAVTPDAAEAFFEHYTEINNEANSQQDPELISTVETGPLLQTSQMGYEIQQVQGRDPIEPFTIAPSIVAAPGFDAYPMWFVAVSDPADGAGYYLVTREDASSPWLVSLSVYPSEDAPLVEPAIDGGVAERAGGDLPVRGADVLESVAEFAETGDEPEDVDVSHAGGLDSLHEHGLHLPEGDDEYVDVERTCSMADDDVQWLAAEGGAFAMTSISCTQTAVMTDDDFHMRLDEDGFGILPGDTELRETEITHGVSFIVAVSDDGSATVIGESMLPYDMDYTEP